MQDLPVGAVLKPVTADISRTLGQGRPTYLDASHRRWEYCRAQVRAFHVRFACSRQLRCDAARLRSSSRVDARRASTVPRRCTPSVVRSDVLAVAGLADRRPTPRDPSSPSRLWRGPSRKRVALAGTWVRSRADGRSSTLVGNPDAGGPLHAQPSDREGSPGRHRGPYRYLRHPSYTGAILMFAGVGIGLGNALSFAACVVLPAIGFVRRIPHEEALLSAQSSASRTPSTPVAHGASFRGIW